jgi:hypothetical protein
MLLKRSRLRRRGRAPLPSLFDRHPDALSASRHPRGVRDVLLDAIVGTARHPTQNTADFRPLPSLRGRNWEARWQRILEAMGDLAVLPPVDLLQVGHEYWVVDGHNRIGAALRIGAVAIDADVTELLLPGVTAEGHAGAITTTMVGSEEVRQAGEGRRSQRVEFRPEELSRQELAASAEREEEAEEAAEAAREVVDDREPGTDR